MNRDDVPLENRIATALAATDITSSDLSQLLIEADAAIAAADKAAEEERSKALDPALSPDPKAARAAMEDAAFTRDRLKTLLPRLQTKHKEVADVEVLAAWRGEAAELQERRLALGTKFGKEYPDLMNPILNQLWAMRALDKEINELNRRRPASAAAVEQITPAFAKYLKVPDPEVGEKYWENGSAGGYVWPPRQLSLGEQMARAMMAGTYPLDNYMDCLNWYEKMEERNRRMLEDNRKQIAEAEQRQRERQEREAAEARKAQEAERAAYYAKMGWPT
jgi:hypothetical protein